MSDENYLQMLREIADMETYLNREHLDGQYIRGLPVLDSLTEYLEYHESLMDSCEMGI